MLSFGNPVKSAPDQFIQPALNPGGADPQVFAVAEAWYPVFYLADLDPKQPHPFTLLGADLVIWWDQAAQQWRAFADQCPHRLARLSEGRIAEDGLIECPYHGWAFQGDGRCDRIPQQPEQGKGHLSARACVRSYPTFASQGLLFIYAGEAENAAQVKVPTIPVLEAQDSDWVCFGTFRDLPYDATTLLENVLDASHLPFTHHRSVGNRANAAPMELEIIESSKQGFRGTWAEGPRRGKLGRQDTYFVAPNLMWHEINSEQLGRTLTVVYATPTRKGECRLFARFPFKFKAKLPRLILSLTPTWYSHLGQNAILEDDQIFLHHQERYLAAKRSRYSQSCYLPTAADRYVSEFHQWLDQFQAQAFPGQDLPAAQTRTELLDRYHSHTSHCQSCRGALQNIQRWRLGIALGSGMALVAAPWHDLGYLLPAIGGLIWWGLGQLERRFYQGRAIPPRNL
ncbi:MAG: Rieske 2Fe-2S domain-containing protein [Pseudanabaenaceae cyanobacterium bins.68]|nr:Rieske 2Fe-2S domain-containing protein [Pseudanabaenaceae cyanobacterium bins.68]